MQNKFRYIIAQVCLYVSVSYPTEHKVIKWAPPEPAATLMHMNAPIIIIQKKQKERYMFICKVFYTVVFLLWVMENIWILLGCLKCSTRRRFVSLLFRFLVILLWKCAAEIWRFIFWNLTLWIASAAERETKRRRGREGGSVRVDEEKGKRGGGGRGG